MISGGPAFRFFPIGALFVLAIAAATIADPTPPTAVPSGAASRALMEEGRRRYGAGDFEGAKAFFEAAEQRATGRLDPARAQFNAGAALYRLGRLDEAENKLSQALHTSDLETQAQTWYNLARAAIERAEQSAAAGQASAAVNPMERAVEALRNAIRLAPDDLEAKINFEWARRRLEELKEMARQQEQQQQQQETQPQEQKQPEETPRQGENGAEEQTPQTKPEPSDPSDSSDSSPRPEPSADSPRDREMTTEDVARLLDALRAEEEAMRRQIRRPIGPLAPVEKDW